MTAGTEINSVIGFKAIINPKNTSVAESLSSCVSYNRENIFRTGKSLRYCHIMFGLMMMIKAIIFHQNLCLIKAYLVVLKKNNADNPKMKNTASYFAKKPNATVSVKYHKYFRSRSFTYLVN